MHIFESIINLFVKFFSVLGAVSGGKVCSAYFDEPEVPKKLQIYTNNLLLESVYIYGSFNSVLLAIIQSVLLFVNVKTLTNIKYTIRDYIAMICIIIPSTIIYYFISEKTTIFY